MSGYTSLAEAERLEMLIEECSEIIKCGTKILRHGWESYNPDGDHSISNKDDIEREIGDLHRDQTSPRRTSQMNQEENEQSQPVRHPIEMERQFHRQDYNNGKLTIVFLDAAHLADSWNYADKIGKSVEFERAVMRLIRVNLGRCVPQKAWKHSLGTEKPVSYPALAGRENTVKISADSHTQPSFFWAEEPKGMVGGLIFHSYSGDWGIHT